MRKNLYRMRLNKQCLVLLLFAATAAEDFDYFEGSADFDSCWVRDFPGFQINIARGSTDPEIDSMTWIKFSNNMAPLA